MEKSKEEQAVEDALASLSKSVENKEAPASEEQYAAEWLGEKLKHYKEEHELRKLYMRRLFRYLKMWSALVLTALFFSGFNFCGFSVSDAVMCTLLGTTFAQIVGLTAIAFKWLFPKKD